MPINLKLFLSEDTDGDIGNRAVSSGVLDGQPETLLLRAGEKHTKRNVNAEPSS